MLTKSPIQTVYHDTHTKVTSVYIMRDGVPQGGSMSSAFFNLGQSRCIRAASRLHPTVSILGQPDDAFMTNFVNKTVVGIFRELDQLQAFVEGPIGNMRASTQTIYTVQCSTTYSPSPHLLTFYNSSFHSSAGFCHSINRLLDYRQYQVPPTS